MCIRDRFSLMRNLRRLQPCTVTALAKEMGLERTTLFRTCLLYTSKSPGIPSHEHSRYAGTCSVRRSCRQSKACPPRVSYREDVYKRQDAHLCRCVPDNWRCCDHLPCCKRQDGLSPPAKVIWILYKAAFGPLFYYAKKGGLTTSDKLNSITALANDALSQSLSLIHI